MIVVDFCVLDNTKAEPKMVISGWDPIIEAVAVVEVDSLLFYMAERATESGEVFTFWRDDPGVLSIGYIPSATPGSG